MHYRPQPLWMPMGLVVGGLAGGAVGAVALGLATALRDPSEIVVGAAFGAVYGGPWGAATGLAVGVAMTFLVGSHLGRAAAQQRAVVCGPLSTLAALTVTLLPFLEDPVFWAVLGAGVALAAPISTWIAGLAPEEARP